MLKKINILKLAYNGLLYLMNENQLVKTIFKIFNYTISHFFKAI